MVRLTTLGKVIVGLIVVIIAFFAYQFFSAPSVSERDAALAEPAPIPAGVKFPLISDQAQERFDKAAEPSKDKVTYCTLFSDYANVRSIPLDFDALLVDHPQTNPYYFVDVRRNMEFVPAYLVEHSKKGLTVAKALSDGDTDQLNPCGAVTQGIILLGFYKGQRPTTNLVRIRGILWWDSLSLNPGQRSTEAGAETADAPIVLVGHANAVSPSQIADQASYERILNLTVARGPVVIRVSRIEFSSDETRIWIEMSNRGNLPAPAWPGDAATLRQEGGPSLKESSNDNDSDYPGANSNSSDNSDSQATLDSLPMEPIPTKGSGTLVGYLRFPPVDPSKAVYLNLPEPLPQDGFASTGSDSAPITIKLPGDLNTPTK